MADYRQPARRVTAPMAALCVLLIVGSPGRAQSYRGGDRAFVTPNRVRVNSPVDDFRGYSYGLGNPSPGPAGGTGAVGPSALPGLPGRSAAPSPAGGLPGTPAFNPAAAGQTVYRAQGPRTDFGPGGISRELTALTAPDRAAGVALLDAFKLDGADMLDRDEPITTFVPSGVDPQSANRYVELLLRGEQSMRARRYRQASELFTQVRHIAPQSPEALLSLAHANMGTGNYWLMSAYIRQAIDVLPQLPRARISLRAFFASSAEFVGLREQLRQVVGEPGSSRAPAADDASVLLALVYVEWFDGNTAVAREYLLQAARLSRNPLLSDSLESFWAALVRAGQASGPLVEQAGLVVRLPEVPPPGGPPPTTPTANPTTLSPS